MNIVVCVKQTPSSEARITLAADRRSVDRSGVEMVVNPYDEYAVEAALQTRDKFGGNLTAVCLGGGKAEEALRHCLALGADRAVQIKEEALLDGDPHGTATVLAAAVRALSPDIVFCGKVAIDVENFGTGVALAEFLDLPHVSMVSEIEWVDEKSLKVHREIEGATERLEVTLPAVLTAEKGLNDPRYPKLPGIMKAKKIPIEEMTAATLGVDAGRVGGAGRRVETVAMEPPPAKTGGKKYTGDAREAVREILKSLREERKIL